MPFTSNAIASCCLLLTVLALAGCSSAGTSANEATTARVQREVALESPALAAGTRAIPRRYTCDGKDASLPLQWAAVPAGTNELAVLILALEPIRTSEGKVLEKVTTVWAVAGLQPTLRRLASGSLPPGAIVGRNAHGRSAYSICPPKGQEQNYLIALFASPRRLSAAPGFSDESLFAQLSKSRTPFGQLFVGYARA